MRIKHGYSPLLLFVLAFIALSASRISAWQGLGQAPTPNFQDSDVEALIGAGHWKRARTIVEPRVEARPGDPRSCYELAEVRFAFKDFEAALPLAQHAVGIDAKNSNYHLELGKVYGELAARAGLISAGPLALKFRKEVEIALELDPTNLDALDTLMQFKYQAPWAMGGNKDAANALVEKITVLNMSEGYLSHAELAVLAGNQAEQEAYLVKAVQANPKNYGANASLAQFYSESTHFRRDEAAKLGRDALHLDPQRIKAYWILARVLTLEQRWSDMEQVLDAAAKNVPDDRRPFYEAGQALLEIGMDFPKAERYAKSYLSQEPEGEEPDAADGHRLLALVLEKEGRNEEARAELKAALRLRPNFKSAKEDLKRITN